MSRATSHSDYVAAVDLGSNSFHMVIAAVRNGHLRVVDRLRDPVRLTAGIGPDLRLSADAQQRALACLQRFGHRLRGVPATHVRAVGTNALRRAKDTDRFLALAQEALGHPVEIIAGREEARLIYLGVAHSVQCGHELRRLVVDIGGGSTEVIVGEGFSPLERESLHVGCVELAMAYFADGKISDKALQQAQRATEQQLQPHIGAFRRVGWDNAMGCSGSVSAIAEVLTELNMGADGITLEGLRKLRNIVAESRHIDNFKFTNLREDRRPIFPSGLAILLGIFETLGISSMGVSDGALREGVLYDLVGRMHQEDVRDKTVDSLCGWHDVDLAQATRVERTADIFYQLFAEKFDLDLLPEARRYLRWAARLHEIGLTVAHDSYHKHGAYLIEHGDLPGFSRQGQRVLAALVRGQRRKLPDDVFNALPGKWNKAIWPLSLALRLAVLMNRARLDIGEPSIHAHLTDTAIQLQFPPGWLQSHPLTDADLEAECSLIKKSARFKLEIIETPAITRLAAR
jgi:exopolyphosphatase / guanosine-5'-triphosphate,3'-diphosphate pyrophosphatase